MSWIYTFLLVILFVASSRVFAVSLKAIRENNKGVERLHEESYYAAYEKFVKALGEAPYAPRIHLNLGLSFEGNEQYGKAYRAYLSAARQAGDDKDLQFRAYFNAARMAAKNKDIPQALSLYQKALDLEPGSKKAKTNIELLWKKKKSGGKGKGKKKSKKKKKKQGKKKSNKKKKSGNKKKQNKKQNKKGPPKKKKQQPKPFKSKDLTKNEVRQILEELRNQEQKIRAKQYEKDKAKESSHEKNW